MRSSHTIPRRSSGIKLCRCPDLTWTKSGIRQDRRFFLWTHPILTRMAAEWRFWNIFMSGRSKASDWAIWSADPNPGPAAEAAMGLLCQIDPQAKCYPQAQALMKNIEARVKAVTDANAAHERDMEKALLKAEEAIETARINAAREVALEYAKNQPKVVYKVYGWW